MGERIIWVEILLMTLMIETIMSKRNGDSPKSDRIAHVVIFYNEPHEGDEDNEE